jgi:ribokinase
VDRIYIAVVGSCNIDLTFRVSQLPQPGETLAGTSFQLGHGGKGANQAVMAARLGAKVYMIARVGADSFGDSALDNLQAEGIRIRDVKRDDSRPTGVAAILVDDAGQNCIVVVPGANGALMPQDIQDAAETIKTADVLLCQLEVPIETTRTAVRLARENGVRTIFNPAPAAEIPDDLFQAVDVCIPNERELAQLTGRPVESLEQIGRAAKTLLQRGPRVVVVSVGERGAIVVDGTRSVHLPAPAVMATDSSGAGDAFIGAFAVSWLQTGSIIEAAKKANAIAADTVTRIGTQTSFPRKSASA